MDKPIRLASWTLNLHNYLKWTPQATLQVDTTYTNICNGHPSNIATLKQTCPSTLQLGLSTYTLISNRHPIQHCNLTSRPTRWSQMDTPINLVAWPVDLHNEFKHTSQSNLQLDLSAYTRFEHTPQSALHFDVSTYTTISIVHPNQPCN